MTFVTVRVNASLTELPPPSVAVTVMTWEPTSAFSGVPEIVPLLMLKELGAPDIVKVIESSTSVNALAAFTL